jgi:hypothetical protein
LRSRSAGSRNGRSPRPPSAGQARALLDFALRRRRALVAASLALIVGPMLVSVVVLAVLHAVNPGKYGPAGGVDNLGGALGLLTQIGSVAAVLIGVSAGGGDLGAGVFRELVVTGRSRLALFAARIPGRCNPRFGGQAAFRLFKRSSGRSRQ